MEHDDFFLRLNAVASIEANQSVGYRLTAHEWSPAVASYLLARADAMKRVIELHDKAVSKASSASWPNTSE